MCWFPVAFYCNNGEPFIWYWSFSGLFQGGTSHTDLEKTRLGCLWSCDPVNYRPISNLHTLSKLLERLFLARLQPHLASTGRMDPYQSAYRMQSSSETALLKVASDLYDGILDDGWVSILVKLDISAAFDTIDASILLGRMEVYFGVTAWEGI